MTGRPEMSRVERAERSVKKLLYPVRANHPEKNELYEYLDDYCRASWLKGYESAVSEMRRRKAAGKRP